jgi:hypothetical protein
MKPLTTFCPPHHGETFARLTFYLKPTGKHLEVGLNNSGKAIYHYKLQDDGCRFLTHQAKTSLLYVQYGRGVTYFLKRNCKLSHPLLQASSLIDHLGTKSGRTLEAAKIVSQLRSAVDLTTASSKAPQLLSQSESDT